VSLLAWKELSTDFHQFSDEELYFLFQIEKGWQRKLGRLLENNPEKTLEYWPRLKEEVQVILKMKFAGYFLITQDFLTWADTVGIRRGPGRGSAAGSLIAYLMDITRVDPLKYDLLFSRFLNADRVSMPDIDNDIETDRRDEVKEYIKQKYGEDRVASISTFGTMKVRGGIKDIIRSLNIGGSKTEAFKLADQVNNLIPNDSEISFDDACKQAPEFKALVWYPSEEDLQNGWKAKLEAGEVPSRFPQVGLHIRKLEGMIRQTGTHAAGVIISPEKLSTILPMAIDKNDVTVTANHGKMVEDAGFLKIDLLGLNTLSIIQRCVENIKKTRNLELKGMPMTGMPLVVNESEQDFNERLKEVSEPVQQASKAYRLLRSGKTEGIFQCESSVAKGLLQDLQANNIDDISAVLALNRPGPLKAGLTKEFGGRKFGSIPWELPHLATEKILGPTFGILCYQEQCMQLAVTCAGFTMSESDTLRKAIGKKNIELMVKFEKQFVEGCYRDYTGFDKVVEYELLEELPDGSVRRVLKKGTIAQRLWQEIVFFAGYGFNRSHSVSYAFNTYYTAFLKANYPAEFWAAQLSYESDQVKINKMVMEAKSSGIQILPVSVNTSSMGYESESPSVIRRSLGTLKAVGGSAITELCAHRPYRDPVDFLLKCNMRKINKKTLHALICAGAFEEFGITRKTLAEKIQDCKFKLDKWCKRRLDNYIKFAGAHKTCMSKPTEADLIRLGDPTSGDEVAFEKADSKYKRIRHISRLVLAKWLQIKDSVKPEEEETLEEAQKAALKELFIKWEIKANQIFQEDEWEYNFVATEEDKKEWPLETLIANEKEVYGTAVSAHVFDKYVEVEKRVDEKFPTNRFTLDQSTDELSQGMEVVLLVEVIGCSRQFPYKKDPTKFVRLFQVEDRYGAQELTVFDKVYDEFLQDENGTPVRVMSAGNILVCKAKMSFYGSRKSLVYESCVKLVASGRKRGG
jgi:DNA polymerase III alpha subunit